ncbi:MAG: PrsW family intramembrane metalloprotease [Chloroflexota bacterium]|nr:PrsW family intramembrane metalloprotease [Chloroflexota bacterium]
MHRRFVLIGLLVAGLLLVMVFRAAADPPGAQADPPLTLAARYAPALFFHEEEVFRPQGVAVMIDHARLRVKGVEQGITNRPGGDDLFHNYGAEYFLDLWYGAEGNSGYLNYTAHRDFYDLFLRPGSDRQSSAYPVTAYTHVTSDEASGRTALQYWLFYYYNDSYNKHEGDWEMVTVVLDADQRPEFVTITAHHGGTRRLWENVHLVQETHPAVYVARGSHANYFVGPEFYPIAFQFLTRRVSAYDRTGSEGAVVPQVVLIPSREELLANPDAYPDLRWLRFEGHWGEQAFQADFGGPLGPADKGDQWEKPVQWAEEQPWDEDEWYHIRPRSELSPAAAAAYDLECEHPAVSGWPEMEHLTRTGTGGEAVIFHVNPAADTPITVRLRAVDAPPVDAVGPMVLNVTWPDVAGRRVGRFSYDLPEWTAGAEATLLLHAGSDLALAFDADGDGTGEQAIGPSAARWEDENFQPQDVVVLTLTAAQVVSGVSRALVLALIPPVIYLLVVWWADRYEREPLALIIATFVWGALPALLLAAVLRLGFELPLQVLGRHRLEVVSGTLLAPLIEELLKAAAIALIYWRWRDEFDNVLDGIVYGSMVGFGFAMTANLLTYIGNFLFDGYAGLNRAIFLQGVVFGLNQALYSALVGAGFGLARAVRKGRGRWLWPLAGLLIAVAAHTLQNTATHLAATDVTPWLFRVAVVSSWAGVLVVVAVLVGVGDRERRLVARQMQDEVARGTLPAGRYDWVKSYQRRLRVQWRTVVRGQFRRWWTLRRFTRACTELAFRKERAARLGPDSVPPGLIDRLRRQVIELRAQLEAG